MVGSTKQRSERWDVGQRRPSYGRGALCRRGSYACNWLNQEEVSSDRRREVELPRETGEVEGTPVHVIIDDVGGLLSKVRGLLVDEDDESRKGSSASG